MFKKKNSCWLQPIYSIVSVIIPIGLILTINLVFFVMIIVNYSKQNIKRKKYLHTLSIDKESVKKEIILVLSCFTNTGKLFVQKRNLFNFILEKLILIKYRFNMAFWTCNYNTSQ